MSEPTFADTTDAYVTCRDTIVGLICDGLPVPPASRDFIGNLVGFQLLKLMRGLEELMPVIRAHIEGNFEVESWAMQEDNP